MSTWPHSKKLTFAFGEGKKSDLFIYYNLFCEANLLLLKKPKQQQTNQNQDPPYSTK